MKPEYRSLDPLSRTAADAESLASLALTPAVPDGRTRTIGELARECDVTLRALRFYEGKGLLAPRRAGTTRLYDCEDVRRLKLVLRLKRVGFSLVAVREILEMLSGPADAAARLAMLGRRVEEQVAVLEEQREDVERSLVAVAEEIAALRRTVDD